MEAATKYTEWGAIAKVEQMKTEYPSIKFENRQHRVSSAIHSREWFDANVDSVGARSWATSSSSGGGSGAVQGSLRFSSQQMNISKQFSTANFVIDEEPETIKETPSTGGDLSG
jgi:hypothetical protein